MNLRLVSAMDRALLVDLLAVSEQEAVNAWAGRMYGAGSVVGFFVYANMTFHSMQYLIVVQRKCRPSRLIAFSWIDST